MGRGDMRLQHVEGQDGVTKSMRVGGWTGPKASRRPFDRARAAETSLVTQTSELLGRTRLLLRTLCTMTGPQSERVRAKRKWRSPTQRSPTHENTSGSISALKGPLEGTFYHNGGTSRLLDGNCLPNPQRKYITNLPQLSKVVTFLFFFIQNYLEILATDFQVVAVFFFFSQMKFFF